MAVIERCYAINKSSNSVYYSDDFGTTWTEIPSNVSTTSASDIGASPTDFDRLLVLNGATAATTPYLSTDGAVSFSAGANMSGKEILFLSTTAVVTGGKRLKSNTGTEISISLDGGASFSQTIDTSSLFTYPGAVANNITVMSVDFTSSAGGYIAIAGDGDNSLADQILARTVDRGNSFPDAIILSGADYGVIRCVISNPEGRVLFASGDPGLPGRGNIYSIDTALTDIPVRVKQGISAGDITNNRITKFFRRPSGSLDVIFFLDSSGNLIKTENGGTTWINRGAVPGNCVDIMAINDSTLIALTASPNAIYKSVSDGITWQQVAQPTWNNPEALAYNTLSECLTCPPGYTEIGTINSRRCEKFQIAGPICKPPYEYFAIDERCASPSDITPANIVYAIDYSSSVDTNESLLFVNFLLNVNDLIADRLAIGSVEVAIVKWAEHPCLTLPFTSDVDEIRNNILNTAISCSPFGIFTNHIGAFCESVTALYEKSLERPEADNILIIFTDGAANINETGCDLRSIGLNPAVPIGDSETTFDTFLSLAKKTKETLNNKGLKIMVVMVGSATDREEIREQFIDGPLSRGIEPYPSQSPGGNYYLFDGGDFADVNSIVQQIRLGLASQQYPTEPCPTGCIGVAGDDNLGYCECRDEIVPVKCLYKLTECSGAVGPIYTSQQVFSFWFSGPPRLPIVRLSLSDVNYFPGCFSISKVLEQDVPSIPESEIFMVSPDQTFETCELCGSPSYVEFTDCAGSANTQYSTDVIDWQNNYLDLGFTVVKSSRADLPAGVCWSGRIITELPVGAVPVDFTGWIIPGEQYAECIDCLPIDIPSYRLSDTCQNLLPDIYTQEDFSGVTGQIVKVLQYPNKCWDVSINLDSSVTHEVLTLDGLPFSTCVDCLPSRATIYTLTNCQVDTDVLATESNLSQYLGQIVRLTTTGDVCWIVDVVGSTQLATQDVSVIQAFSTCPDCYPLTYKFVSCENRGAVKYTRLDFSEYVGQIVRVQEYPGVCWNISIESDISVPVENLTLQGQTFERCEDCVTAYYQLTNCANPEVFLISSTDLSIYMGRTVTLAGYPGLCFTVSEPKCDCILVSINNIDYTVYSEPALFNGRKRYIFETESGDTLGVAWNTNPNQWELFDTTTLEAYGYSTLDSACPFSNLWTVVQGAPYIITSIGFCAEQIFNVAPELDFDNCLPCIKCI